MLPILTAPPPPTANKVQALARQTAFKGEFRHDLIDSDALHWGEGVVLEGDDAISLVGTLAPGPDYKL